MSSIMSELADEVLKPVKTGLFVASAVVVVGLGITAANSKPGRKFLGNAKKAVFGDGKPKTAENDDKKTNEVVIDIEVVEEDKKPSTAIEQKDDVHPETKMIGVDNV